MAKAEQISEFLRERIGAGDFPSAVYLVAERGEAVFSGALGNAVAEPEKIAARTDTIYDLASLTKVLVTGLLCAKLLEDSKIQLDQTLAEYFAEFKTPDKKETTIRQLLAHTSGFAAWKPFYLLTGDADISSADIPSGEAKRARVIELIAAEPLACAPDTKVVYSDLNFLMLGFLAEKIYAKIYAKIYGEKNYGARLDTIAAGEIFHPLGLQRTFFNPPAEFKAYIAASERGNNFEKQTCLENGYDTGGYHWRENIIRGEVHDGNAYFLDGVAGHAGIFSTAGETLEIAKQFLPGSTKILKPETCRLFSENLTPGLNEARSAAFQLAATPDSAAGDALAKDSFGHLGFTGTSLWIEPGTERVFILLTNRTHARELPFVNINSTRRQFHRLAINALNGLHTW